jgi:hypothetical protein
MPTDRPARVRAAYDAFATADRDAIEALLAPDFTFHAPPDPHLDRDGFFARCWPGAGMATAGFRFVRLAGIGDDEVLRPTRRSARTGRASATRRSTPSTAT